MKKVGDKLVLSIGEDFSPKRFMEFLNEKYGSKSTGKPFTKGDCQQYVLKGQLPDRYGAHPVSYRTEPGTGLKIITVDFSASIKKDEERG